MGTTKIEWTDKVWNPITGCSPVSEGCRNCYAKRMANRLRGRYGYPKDEPSGVTFHPERLEKPLHWKKPSKVFVCSMGDLFHKDVAGQWIIKIFQIMKQANHHTFLILTKRLQVTLPSIIDLPNVWLGVSVENQRTADERIPILLQIPAAKRFISVEPMLGPVDTPPKALCPCSCYAGNPRLPHPDCEGKPSIDWVICGGETGPGARPLHPDWVRSLRDQCWAVGVPIFIKTFPINGKLSNRMDEWPEDVRIRRYPDAL